MGAIKEDTGAGLAQSMRDAAPLARAVQTACLGLPAERVVTALTMVLTRAAARSGMNVEEFVTYVRQQFVICSAADKGPGALDAAVATLPRRGVDRGEIKENVDCTGISAAWCPRCGDCTCQVYESGERSLNDENCLLHNRGSEHGETPPPDTGWRDRPPTEAEAAAHATAHPSAAPTGCGWWMVRAPDGYLDTVTTSGAPPHATVAMALMEGWHWRPITASGAPAPWPEVTRE